MSADGYLLWQAFKLDVKSLHAYYCFLFPAPAPVRPACSDTNVGGGAAPLDELAASFARFFGSIDVEKTDAVVGLALAQIMQVGGGCCCGLHNGIVCRTAPPIRSLPACPIRWRCGCLQLRSSRSRVCRRSSAGRLSQKACRSTALPQQRAPMQQQALVLLHRLRSMAGFRTPCGQPQQTTGRKASSTVSALTWRAMPHFSSGCTRLQQVGQALLGGSKH